MHLLSKIKLILSSPCHIVVKNEYIYMHALHPTIHVIPCAFFVCIYIFMHIGSPKGITLLEFEAMGEEDQQETQQQEVLEAEG